MINSVIPTSTSSEKQGPLRPTDISVIAIFYIAIAAYLVVNGVLVASAIVSFASGRYILGDYASMGPGIYFAVGLGIAVVGMGLLRGWSFARRMAIVAAALLLATSVLPISAAVAYLQIAGIVIHGLKVILAVIAIRYLVQPEVVDYFSARSAR
ncbi:MAG: hypothetical protein ACXVZV_02040 [Terriglobales bacterium]